MEWVLLEEAPHFPKGDMTKHCEIILCEQLSSRELAFCIPWDTKNAQF